MDGAWPPLILQNSRVELTKLVETLDKLDDSTSDDFVKYLSRFLVIRACGHIEFSLAEAVSLHSEHRSHPYIASYVRSGLSNSGRNPKPGSISEILKRLSPDWAAEFDEMMAEDSDLYSRELSFLVDRRNKIAHGQSEGVGRRKALDLAKIALHIADWIIETLNPKS